MTRARRLLQDLMPTQVSVMLVECGRLKNADVKSISIHQLRETDISCTAVLTLFYSSGVLDVIPAQLFVKVAEWHGTKHALEVDFYQSVGPFIQWLNRRIKHSPFDSAVGLLICDNCINAFDDLACEDLLPA